MNNQLGEILDHIRQEAKCLAAQGHRITLCRGDNLKRPLGENWGHKIWTAEEIDRAFVEHAVLNVGLVLGRDKIDIEADSPEEEAAFAELFRDCEVPVTPTFKSRRGKHRLFAWHPALAGIQTDNRGVIYFTHNGAKLGVRIGNDKQIQSVVPPSINDDGSTREWLVPLEECPLATLPSVVVDRLIATSKPPQAAPAAPSVQPVTPPANGFEAAIRRKRAELRIDELEPSIAHHGGDAALWNAACEIYRFGLNDSEARGVLERYNRRAQPPWDNAALTHKLNDARQRVMRDGEFGKFSHAKAKPFDDGKFRITFKNGAELSEAAKRPIDYRIVGALVNHEPLIIAGPEKSLKTGVLVDLAVSLCTGRPFLNHFNVVAACNVMFLSGESGEGTLSRSFAAAADNKNIRLNDLTNLYFSTELPQIEMLDHLAEFEDAIRRTQAGVVIVDPFYFCIDGSDAGNLFVQGRKLRALNGICRKHNALLCIAHHFNAGDSKDRFRKPSLRDISWAGFKQFARQWWLLGRRADFVEGSGFHDLHFLIGSSAFGSSAWQLKVHEGSDPENRVWVPSLTSATAAAKVSHELRIADLEQELIDAIQECDDCTATLEELRKKTGNRTPDAKEAFEELLARNIFTQVEVERGKNKRKCKAAKYTKPGGER